MKPRAERTRASLVARVQPAVQAAVGAESAAPVVVAVSGGIDSMVLLAAIAESQIPAIAVHVHHALRGSEADADADLVASECSRRGIPFEIVRLEPGWEQEIGRRSLQDAARERRYAALEAVARATGASCIVTGHNRDDQAETVLMHLSRGTGPDGLAGMRRVRALPGGTRLVRPLLDTGRAEIEAFARERGVAWREDASNRLGDYRRNAIRHTVMPALEGVAGPGVAARIARAADLVRGALDSERDPLERTLLALLTSPTRPDGLGLALGPWLELGPVWRGRIALAALETAFPGSTRDRRAALRIESLAHSQVGRKWSVPGGAVWRERNALVFARGIAVPDPIGVSPDEPVEWLGERIVIRSGRADALGGSPAPRRTFLIDADSATGPWILRAWTAGDRIAPVGHPGRARVKVLLTDAGVPARLRAGEPVLEAGGRIVALPGHAVDRAFAVRTGTCRVFEIVREPGSPTGD